MTEEQRWVLRSVRNTVGHPINHDLADAIDATLRRVERLERLVDTACGQILTGDYGAAHGTLLVALDGREGRD